MWVRLQNTSTPIKVSAENCEKINDFIKVCQASYYPLLDSCPDSDLAISLNGIELNPNDAVSSLTGNTASTSLQLFAKNFQVEFPPTHGLEANRTYWPNNCDFWNSLAGLELRRDETGVEYLQLPDQVYIMGFPDLGSTIIVRRCYQDIVEEVGIDRCNVSVSGTSGAGTTYMAYYLLWLIKNRWPNSVVVFRHQCNEDAYVFAGSSVYNFPGISYIPSHILRHQANFLIVDGHAMPMKNARRIQLTSTSYNLYHSFVKQRNVTLRFIPTWTWDEIAVLWNANYRDTISLQEVHELCYKWGMMPRFSLVKARDEGFQQMMMEYVGHIYSFDRLITAFEFPGYHREKWNEIVTHLKVANDYIHKTEMIASDFLADIFLRKLEIYCKEELVNFIRSYQYGIKTVIRENLLEAFAHRQLSSGLSFTIRDLQNMNESTLSMPKRSIRHFRSWTDFKLEISNDYYFRPLSKDFKLFSGAFVAPDKLFRIAVDTTCPIKIEELEKLREEAIIDPNQKLQVIFVVPEKEFESFSIQRYVDVEVNEFNGNLTKWVKENVQQYVNTNMSLDTLITKATSETNTSEDWSVIISICEQANRSETTAKEAVTTLSRRLQSKNVNVILFSLTLSNALVQNCGPTVHRQISSKQFLDPIVALANASTTHTVVKQRILDLLESWADEFKGRDDVGYLVDVWKGVKEKNIGFGQTRERELEREKQEKRKLELEKQKEEEEYQLALALSLSAQEASKPASLSTSTSVNPPSTTDSSTPQQPKYLFKVKALYDFAGMDEGELRLNRDDIVSVLDSTTFKEWWKGEHNGKIGIFPANYVQKIPGSEFGSSGSETIGRPATTNSNLLTVEALLAKEEKKVSDFIMLLATVNPQKDNLSENEKIQELYHDMIMLRPKLLKLIEGYRDKQDELVQLNERFTKAATSYHRMSEASVAQYMSNHETISLRLAYHQSQQPGYGYMPQQAPAGPPMGGYGYPQEQGGMYGGMQ
ncbi:ESCRT-0 subunit protein hse1 [Nowakowskiella sp. JEL0407]|nr:ESCRT-0 subunit protein hse1 [Nowakowskiella sp. JEL0407]